MSFFLENWYLFLAATVSGVLLFVPAFQRRGGSGSVSTTEAVQLLNREKAVMVDVSEPAEFAAAHAAGSRNVPFGSLETAKNLPTNKSLPVLLMCPSGARAGRAVGMLRKLGYEQAHSVAGGLRAWREANLPIEKSV